MLLGLSAKKREGQGHRFTSPTSCGIQLVMPATMCPTDSYRIDLSVCGGSGAECYA